MASTEPEAAERADALRRLTGLPFNHSEGGIDSGRFYVRLNASAVDTDAGFARLSLQQEIAETVIAWHVARDTNDGSTAAFEAILETSDKLHALASHYLAEVMP